MNTNFEYNRFHAQSKIRELQQEGIRSQQLRKPAVPKTSPATKTQARHWFQTLKTRLLQLAYP